MKTISVCVLVVGYLKQISNINLEIIKVKPILEKNVLENTFSNSLASLHWLQNPAYFRLCLFILFKSNLLSSPPHTAKWEHKHKHYKNAKPSKMSPGKGLEIFHLNRILDKHWIPLYFILVFLLQSPDKPHSVLSLHKVLLIKIFFTGPSF